MNPNDKINLTGTVAGGASGMGLGMLTARLMGVNPLWGLLGGIPGSIAGNKLGKWYAQQHPYEDVSYQQMYTTAQQLDAQANTNVFTQTLESDPEGFKRNIMPKVKGV